MATITTEVTVTVGLYLDVEGTYDEGESTPLVTVTHAWLRMDGQPDLDVWNYLGGLALGKITRELQRELDEAEDRRERDGTD